MEHLDLCSVKKYELVNEGGGGGWQYIKSEDPRLGERGSLMSEKYL